MDQGMATSQASALGAAQRDAELDVAPVAPRAGSDPGRRVLGRHAPRWWPLAAVLVVQAALSLRLVGANTAFLDEAEYLWAGHLQWAHWLHGAPVPPFSAYFSGAPVIYPPIAALADSIGGLAAARILSLVFMLGATVCCGGSSAVSTTSGPPSLPAHCSPSSARRCTWERSRPTTPWRCF